MVQIQHFQTNSREICLNAAGIPYFSWYLDSDSNNTYQEAYHLTVFSSDGKTVWDSGDVCSQQTAFIPCGNDGLKGSREYQVRLEIRTNHGEKAEASLTFETAPDPSDWSARWVESPYPVAVRERGFGKQSPSSLFGKRIFLSKQVRKARAHATCRGIYELIINGRRAGSALLAPGYSSYEHILYYQTYDVTQLLHQGGNTFLMEVADGWYYGAETVMDRTQLDQPHAVLFQLEIEYADASRETICSDGMVMVAQGPVVSAGLFAGELFDARKKIHDLSSLNAMEENGIWKRGILSNAQNHILPEETPGVEVVAALPVKEVLHTPAGDTILDFGQNMAGRVHVKAALALDAELILEHTEVLDKDGNYFTNILSMEGVGGGCDQKVVFVGDGEEDDFAARFSFQGFRYVRVSGTAAVDPSAFTAEALSSRKEEIGTFACSDPRLNRLYENTLWSQRSNMISIPTDCPQREKAGWTGDISVYAKTALLNEDVTAFLSQWLRSLSVDQEDQNGAVPYVVPFNQSYRDMLPMLRQMGGMSDGPVGAAGWGDAAITVPWAMYEITGNTQILSRQYGSMKAWCDYIIEAARSNHNEQVPEELDRYLWNSGFHFGEWLIPSTVKTGYEGDGTIIAMQETKQYVAPICGYHCVHTFAEICRLLGRPQEAAEYGAVAEKMKDAIGKALIHEDGSAIADYMGAYVMLLYYDLVPEMKKKTVAEHLLACIKNNQGCLDTGFVATPLLLDALVLAGSTADAYDLLFQDKTPSWLGEIAQGATTIWESWVGYDDQKNPLIISQNHYAFGCVDDWMFRNITGIIPLEAGFRTVRIAPVPDRRLTMADRSYRTVNGWLRVRWEKKESDFYMEVTVPCNTKAEILLPDSTMETVGSGTYSFRCSRNQENRPLSY